MRLSPLATLLTLFGAASGPLRAQTASDVEVSPPELQLKVGDRAPIVATAYTASGDVVLSAVFRWSSTDTAVVRVRADASSPETGAVIAVAPGAAVVEAQVGKVRGFATIQVVDRTSQQASPPPPAPPKVLAGAEVPEGARRAPAACADAFKAPAVGAWAEWQTPKNRAKLSVLDTLTENGKTMYRMEMATASDSGVTVLQLLTSTWPNTGQGLEEVIVQARGRPPMRISGQRLAATRLHNVSNPVRVAANRCRGMTDLGEESVTVPAGTFTARHFRDAQGDYEAWIDPKLPFGLVKASSKSGGDVLVAATGAGATTAITGTPREMPARGARPRGKR